MLNLLPRQSVQPMHYEAKISALWDQRVKIRGIAKLYERSHQGELTIKKGKGSPILNTTAL